MAPGRRVVYVPFRMMDLSDRLWNEIAADDKLRSPEAAYFDPFGND